MNLESLAAQMGIKTKDELRQDLLNALQEKHSELDLSVGGALRDLVEVELEQRASDHQLLLEALQQSRFKTASGASLELHALERANLTRLPAEKEIWQVRLGKANPTQTAQIEKGARLQVEGSNPPVYFLAKAAATFTHTLTVDVEFEAEFAGALEIRASQINQLVSGVSGVEWARNLTLIHPGREEESDAGLRRRIEGYYQTLGEGWGIVGWEAHAKRLPFVQDVKVSANQPQRGDLNFHFTTKPGNGIPTPTQTTALQEHLEGYTLFEVIHTHPARAKAFDIHLLIYREEGLPASIQTALQAQIRNLFADYSADQERLPGASTRQFHLGQRFSQALLSARIIAFLQSQEAMPQDLYFKEPQNLSVQATELLQLEALRIEVFESFAAFLQAQNTPRDSRLHGNDEGEDESDSRLEATDD